jgi:hypothetical protein
MTRSGDEKAVRTGKVSLPVVAALCKGVAAPACVEHQDQQPPE